MWMNIHQTYATTAAKNCWARLSVGAWRRIKPTSDSGVTNLHLMLSLAKVHGKKAHVTVDGANKITKVYL